MKEEEGDRAPTNGEETDRTHPAQEKLFLPDQNRNCEEHFVFGTGEKGNPLEGIATRARAKERADWATRR